MICPKCKKYIKYVVEECRGTQVFEMFNDNGKVDFRDANDNFVPEDDGSTFFCPECWENFDYSEAENIVLSEDKLKDMVAQKITKIKQKNKK